MKVVAIVGSPHVDGSSNYLVDQALQEIKSQGVETEKILLCQHIVNPCQGHNDCASFAACVQKDDAPWIIEKFNQADGVILASPVYFWDVTAQIKAFIDRHYFIFAHEGSKKARYAGVIVVGGGGGADETVATLKRFLELPEKHIFVVSGYLGEGGSVKDHPEIVEQARKMGVKLAKELIRKK